MKTPKRTNRTSQDLWPEGERSFRLTYGMNGWKFELWNSTFGNQSVTVKFEGAHTATKVNSIKNSIKFIGRTSICPRTPTPPARVPHTPPHRERLEHQVIIQLQYESYYTINRFLRVENCQNNFRRYQVHNDLAKIILLNSFLLVVVFGCSVLFFAEASSFFFGQYVR